MDDVTQAKINGQKCFHFGVLMLRAGELPLAINAFSQAISYNPHLSQYYICRAMCHKKAGNWREAENDCQEAIKIDPNSYKARYMLGFSLMEQAKHLPKEESSATLIASLQTAVMAYDLAKERCSHEGDKLFEAFSSAYQNLRRELNNQFAEVNGKSRNEVPSYFQCPSSKEIYKDPVVTPDCYSYEKEHIMRQIEECFLSMTLDGCDP